MARDSICPPPYPFTKQDAMKDTIRTFVAVEVTEAVRRQAEVLVNDLQAGGADVKWVEPENQHLS